MQKLLIFSQDIYIYSLLQSVSPLLNIFIDYSLITIIRYHLNDNIEFDENFLYYNSEACNSYLTKASYTRYDF